MSNQNALLEFIGSRVRNLRQGLGLSQEEFALNCGLDRTYISDIERGRRNVSIVNLEAIASTLCVPLSSLFAGLPSTAEKLDPDSQDVFHVDTKFNINPGFQITGSDVLHAAIQVQFQIEELPFALFKSIDLKALSGIVGALFATHISEQTGSIVNPIEKGHPDVIPVSGARASEEELRNYPEGLEIKCTVGNVTKGSSLEPGQTRLPCLTGITWQAHHREVTSLMGLVIDFAGKDSGHGAYPVITGVFYTDGLIVDDWGAISGTTGRNTKVTGMRVSGKQKMGDGWVLVAASDNFRQRYEQILGFSLT